MSSDQKECDEKVDDGKTQLDEQRKLLADEFNVQRAKMKELFLQKEEEMRQICEEKQQLESVVVGLQSQLQELQTLSENQTHELESMQMLIHETMEASSTACAEEVRALEKKNMELEKHLITLRQQASQDTLLAPSALVQTVTRSIARKLGADADDEPKKVTHIQDESELIGPLEEEIKALKGKLRDTDNQLQISLATKKAARGDDKEGDTVCDMCANYEKQLVTEQAKCEEARVKAVNAERALKIAQGELEGARGVLDETVRSWRAERCASVAALEELRASVRECGRAVAEGGGLAQQCSQRALNAVTDLTVQRQTLQDKLNSLERDNAMLVGKYAKKATEMQNEDISLPDTVEELQEYALRAREELIVMCMGREEALNSEAELRAKLLEQTRISEGKTSQYSTLVDHYRQLRIENKALLAEREQIGSNLQSSYTKIDELLNEKKRHQNEVIELRSRVSSLQQVLDNSEKVQQDFVTLSKSLQVQLEHIRGAETEVRWQHEDDVSECPGCSVHLPNNKRKIHCRHCGRIFCSACVCHSVPSGPRRVPARVCSLCRTLLQPTTAPYFSTEAPHAPD